MRKLNKALILFFVVANIVLAIPLLLLSVEVALMILDAGTKGVSDFVLLLAFVLLVPTPGLILLYCYYRINKFQENFRLQHRAWVATMLYNALGVIILFWRGWMIADIWYFLAYPLLSVILAAVAAYSARAYERELQGEG